MGRTTNKITCKYVYTNSNTEYELQAWMSKFLHLNKLTYTPLSLSLSLYIYI